MRRPPVLALTQGDPAGIGPELLLDLVADPPPGCRLVLLAERAALEAVGDTVSRHALLRLPFVPALGPEPRADDRVEVIDPVGRPRRIVPGVSGAADAVAALAALDAGMELARSGRVDALVTLPVCKASLATHCDPSFRGHTDYLARACGLESYGRDYLMAFLTPDVKVALLTVHLPLREALDAITRNAVEEALTCLARHASGRIGVAGLNPHAGEGGLLGREEAEVIRPAVEAARLRGVVVEGPFPADSLFARARGGAFDWVLALYHDQGLVAVKTAAWGRTTNLTLGLPFLRTSVDHGTAFDIAGQGEADAGPLRTVVETTVRLVEGRPT